MKYKLLLLTLLLIPTHSYADFWDVLDAVEDLKRLERSVKILEDVSKPKDIKDSIIILDALHKDLVSPYHKPKDYKQNTQRCEWLIRPGTLEQYTMCVQGK